MTDRLVASALVPEVINLSEPAGLRLPTSVIGEPSQPQRTMVYTPDLSPAETATFDLLLAVARYQTVTVTPAEYDAIRDDIVVIRDLRQLGRNAFMALTAAERDRLMYDAQSATTTILLALLRD